LRFCKERFIHVIAYLANTTHIFQELDLAFFAALKQVIEIIITQK
jgi:hypothetical protein